MKWLLALLLVAQEPASTPKAVPPPTGLALERTVKATLIDWLGKTREVQRKESVLIKGPNVAVTDLTFGQKLILRGDKKTIALADPFGGHYSEYTFDEAAAIRKVALDDLRSVRAHVPGTVDEKEIDAILEGYDQFANAPGVELKSDKTKREVLVNGALVRLSVDVDPQIRSGGTLEALAATGAFHPAVAEQLKNLGGLPMKGRVRYVLFMDRVVEEFEVTSVKPQEIADAEFDVPKGLAKIPLKGFGRPPERKPAKPMQFKRDFGEEGEKKDK
jgi:hypothetical protein